MKKTLLILIFISTALIFGQGIADKYYEAMTAFNSKDYGRAHSLLGEFIQNYGIHDELFATAQFYSGESLLNLGKPVAAASSYEFLVNNFEWSVFKERSLYRLGLIYYETQKYSLCRDRLKQLLDEYPESEFAGSSLYWIGEAYSSENQVEDAIQFFLDAINSERNNKFVDYSLFSLGNIFERTGDYENAVEYYDRLLSYHRDSPLAVSAQIRIGICYFKLKDYQSSILELNNPSLTNLPPGMYAQSLYLLANSYYRVQEYGNAEKTYFEIIQNFPSAEIVKEVKYGLAWSYFQQKKYNDAYKIFNGLSLGSDTIAIKSFYWKAEAKRYAGQENEAFEIFRQFLETYPDNQLARGVQYQLGLLNYNQRKFELAERYLIAAVAAQDRMVRVRALTMLGEIELNKKSFDAARKYFESALDIKTLPDELQNRAMLGLGASLYFLGRYKEAIEYLSDIDIRDANFERNKVNFYLAENQYSLGNFREALNRYSNVDLNDAELGAGALYGKAYSYFGLKDYENASVQFGEFIKRFSGDKRIVDTKLRLADSYFGSKNYVAASEVYKSLVNSRQFVLNDSYAYFQYAQALFKAGKTTDAISEFRNLQQKFPNSEYGDRSLYLIGWINFQRANFSQAIAEYRNMMNIYPNSKLNPVVHYSIGDAYFNIAKYDSAIVNYQKVILLYPTSNYVFDAINGIQYSYVAKGQPDRAIALIDEFVSRNPNLSFSDEIFFKKGEIYYSLREYQYAKKSYQVFISNYPQSELIPDAYFWIGKSAQNLGEEELALFNFAKVYNADIKSETGTAAVIESGKILDAQGKYGNEVALYDKALASLPRSDSYAEILFNKGMALTNQGSIDKSYEVFDEINQYHPNTIFADKAKFELGLIEMAAKRFANAEFYFQKLAESRTDDIGAKAQYFFGVSKFEQQRYAEAITAFVRVRTIFSAYDEWLTKSYLKMGDGYIELKDYKKAEEMFRAVLSNHRGDMFGKEAQNKLRAIR
ncbi:MAG: tetratricopeptide repeat protein [Ignavibacteriaceae bacterium]|nr:tetratricopeptide repeat protein [Ignavibacteriaceae bacterium]